jgi:hypothetical protein
MEQRSQRVSLSEEIDNKIQNARRLEEIKIAGCSSVLCDSMVQERSRLNMQCDNCGCLQDVAILVSSPISLRLCALLEILTQRYRIKNSGAVMPFRL